MEEEKYLMFRNRLVKVYRHLSKQAARQGIACYRIYDKDLPEFLLCIEKYNQRICVAEYKRRLQMADNAWDEWMNRCLQIISEVTGIVPPDIFVRQRKRKAGRQDQYEKLDNTGEFFEVEEGGHRFLVNLTDYLDTGLFLDHRITRSLIQQEACGKEVLNLFCYTGSFSVYASSGKAASVTSVDLSNTYLEWAEKNMRLNNLYDAGKTKFIQADVLQYLDTLPEAFFDLVIMDPPTFSNSKRMDDFLDIQRDHPDLINKTLSAMKEGGALYFSTNLKDFQLEGRLLKASQVKDITRLTTPFDFEGKLNRWCFKLIR
jgi:23S rRNA (cytosine1962-C5)-methyltransferase